MIKSDESLKRLRATSLYDLKERIRRARTLDLSAASDEVIEARIGKIMDGYQTNYLSVAMNGVFRARQNLGTTLYTNVSELWYPKPEFITRRGRFNEAGSPKFYVSNTARGAMFEVRLEVGRLVTILEARTKQPYVQFDTAHIGMEECRAPAMQQSGRARLLHSNPMFREQLRRANLEQKWLTVDNYLSEMSRYLPLPDQEQLHYRVTNSIARTLFRIPNIAALQYPSIATNLSCINLCMLPWAADEYFYAAKAWLVSIDAERDQLPGTQKGVYYGLRFLRCSNAIDSAGNIQWCNERSFDYSEVLHLLN